LRDSLAQYGKVSTPWNHQKSHWPNYTLNYDCVCVCAHLHMKASLHKVFDTLFIKESNLRTALQFLLNVATSKYEIIILINWHLYPIAL